MLKLKDNVNFKELEKFGFKYGTRDKFIFRTKQNGLEASIYIDLLPCHNNNNELHIQFQSLSMPEKIANKLYDIIQADLVEKV